MTETKNSYQKGQKVQIVRGTGDVQTGTVIECITNNQKSQEIINETNLTHQYRINVNGVIHEDVWSESRMTEIKK